jgi:hypothetical protein
MPWPETLFFRYCIAGNTLSGNTIPKNMRDHPLTGHFFLCAPVFFPGLLYMWDKVLKNGMKLPKFMNSGENTCADPACLCGKGKKTGNRH